jgi:hypothetical protein
VCGWVSSDEGDGVRYAEFFGGVGPFFAEKERFKSGECEAVTPPRAVRTRRAKDISSTLLLKANARDTRDDRDEAQTSHPANRA